MIALSYSGETEGLPQALPAAKRLDIPIVAVTGDADSRLAQWSTHVVPMPVPEEACPFNLAPTTTTTALLALGDALAMVLLDARGFTRDKYALLHPAGAIGRSLTLRLADILRPAERTATVGPDATVRDALLEMTRRRAGSVVIVDDQQALLGIFTDGDFRRQAQDDLDVLNLVIADVMTRDPITLPASAMAVAVLKLIEKREVDDVPVVDGDGCFVGIVDIQDLPRFKLM
jgi:arabinose-5-phosphate isomerase